MAHIHRITSIHPRGKRDSVSVECGCGATEIVADWNTELPKGWNKRQTVPILLAIRHFLDAWAWSFPGTKTRERKNAAEVRAFLRKHHPGHPFLKTTPR